MSAFTTIMRTVRDRNFGGTDSNQVADPYISGYFFTKWMLPQQPFWNFGGDTNTGTPGDRATPNTKISSANDANLCLESTCLSLTPPGGTINKAEFTGLGGTKWAVPTNVDYGNSMTCKFVELSGMPVYQVIGSWCRAIRDNKGGVVGNTGITSTNYQKSNYAATVFYWTTKPDGFTVEYAACYSGVFPTKDPQDLFTGDLASVDKLEMDIDFNVDFVWHEEWVYTQCQSYSNWNFKYRRGDSSRTWVEQGAK